MSTQPSDHIAYRVEDQCWFRAVVPFARDISPDEQDSIASALSRFPVRHDATRRRSTEYFEPDRTDVSADAAQLEFALPRDGEHRPSDVLGRATRAIHEWDCDHADPTVNTPAGGEQYLTSIAPPHLDAGELTETGEPSVFQYLVALPDRRLTEREVQALRAAGGDDVRVEHGYIIVFGHTGPFISDPKGTRRLQDIARSSPVPRLETSTEVADRGFWPTREIGTLPDDTDTARKAVASHAADMTPYRVADTDAPNDADGPAEA